MDKLKGFETQNNKENIELLKSMRFYYQKAKQWQNWRLIISFLFIVFIVFLKVKSNFFDIGQNHSNQVKLYKIALVILPPFWLAFSFVLRYFEKKYINLAAKIQEEFDVKIFDLDWNDILIPEKPSPEAVVKGVQKFKGSEESLKNWYPLENLSNNHWLNVLIAQRTNIVWDKKLKQRYKVLLIFLVILFLILELLVSIWLKLLVVDFLLVIFVSSIPFYMLLLEIIFALHSQIKSNEIISSKILYDCKDLTDKSTNWCKNRCRQYQDYIYQANRVKSILIPERLYWLKRKDDNKEALETNRRLLEKYS